MMIRAACHQCGWTTEPTHLTDINEQNAIYWANNHSGVHHGQHVTYTETAISFVETHSLTSKEVADIATY